MRATEATLARLEKLKGKLLLWSDYDGGEYSGRIGCGIGCIVGWKIEDYKPLFGKPYKKITEILVKTRSSVNTKYVEVMTEYLDLVLARAEMHRENFLKVQNDLKDFGFLIKEKS